MQTLLFWAFNFSPLFAANPIKRCSHNLLPTQQPPQDNPRTLCSPNYLKMAPNRKQLALAQLEPLMDTAPLVQAKYLPLTAQIQQQEAPVAPKPAEEPTIIRSNVNSDDYWGWSSSEPTLTVDLFSADRMEANLLADVERRSNATTKVIRAADTSEDYWAERVEAHIVHSESNAAVSEATGYWEWPQDASTVQIALILKEELARNVTSAQTMEARLVEDAKTHTTTESQAKPENDDYWAWTPEATIVRADPSSVNESYWQWNTETAQVKEQVIATIVAYEEIRGMFSAEHIQANLEKTVTPEPSRPQESSDSYWCWPAEEDDYWNERPQSLVQRAEAMPIQGYWDM
ncbi:expressed unknown protein [Seminavis robusta]|uniref:Uncharacterized protein n=1 Tax=Seminavis robusta TaxID=568900 RepID=A0A9N8DKS0_9STRA|nr:expressed unknown protein [Seminavis robusta]|eukprot:Sro139_g065040.1 n/a (346) ;mRNA; f:33308-34345